MATFTWRYLPIDGAVTRATVLEDGRVLGVGTDYELYTLSSVAQWVRVDGSGSVLGVTVLSDGTIVGVGLDHMLYKRETKDGQWKDGRWKDGWWVLVPNSGSVQAVTELRDND